jgi:nitrogen fixation protein FixH
MRILVTITACMLLSAMLFSSACERAQPEPGSTKQTVDAIHLSILEQSSKELGWKGILSLAPFPAESDKDTTLTLRLTDPHGTAIEGARVRFTLFMPLMDMGKEEVEATIAGNGIYVGKGVFSMDGIWLVQADIERGNQKGVLEFEIHVNVP